MLPCRYSYLSYIAFSLPCTNHCLLNGPRRITQPRFERLHTIPDSNAFRNKYAPPAL